MNWASPLIEGNADLFFTRIFGGVVVRIAAFAVTYLLGLGMNKIVGLSVPETDEHVGPDSSQPMGTIIGSPGEGDMYPVLW